MSIRSTVGNMNHSFKDTLSSTLTSIKTKLESIVGSTSTSLSNIWSGGFTGMSESGMAELRTSLENYCRDIEDLIARFDQKGDITSALKGEVQDAAYEFIAAIKELLQAYVSTMKQGIRESQQAYENFLASGKSISQDVQSAASDIRSNAASIRLD